jgi:hypothetical protein
MKDFTLLKMEGQSVDIMCNVCSDYKKRPYMAVYNPLYSGTSYFPARYKEWVSS